MSVNSSTEGRSDISMILLELRSRTMCSLTRRA